MNRLRMVILGRVQGVGFRAFVQREARGLGLAGAVWNRADGAVELEAEGERMALERLASLVGHGSPGSRVAEARVDWSEDAPRHAGFVIAREQP